MNARLYVDFNRDKRLVITVEVDDPLLWTPMLRIAGDVVEIHPGKYELRFSGQNFKRLREYFGTGAKIITGQKHVEKLLAKTNGYKQSKLALAEIKSKERFPLEPNGKLIPRAHQTIIGGAIEIDPYLPIAADCGLGKTPILAYGIEHEIQRGRIGRGKTLISAPLSILDTAWVDDIKRFTSLNPGVLWTKQGNNTILGDTVLLKDFGPKHPFAVTVKRRKKMFLVHKQSRIMIEKILPIDNPADYEKMMVSFSEAILLDGTKAPFGQAVGQPATKDTARRDAIAAILNDPQYDVFIINHDGVRIYEQLLKDHDLEWVAIDESTKIKSPTSQLFDSHCNISWNSKRRNILTGTPNPNGFQDTWAQWFFLDRGLTLEPCMKDFLMEYFVAVPVEGARAGAFKWVLKDAEAKAKLIARLQSSGIFLRQRDCIDLPKRTDITRLIHMSPAQQKAYEDMEDTLVAELYDETTGKRVKVEAVNSLVKLMKLRQITSGFLIQNAKDDVKQEKLMLTDHPKFSDLDSFLENLGDQKVVLCAQFKEEIYALLERYKDWNPRALFGDVSKDKRTETIRSFQTSDDIRMVVIQPAACAHGITLTAACHLVFVSLDYNFDYYYQVAKRIERIGQKSPMFVTHLIARFADGSPTIDDNLMEILARKNADRDDLFGSATVQELEEVANELVDKMIQQRRERHAAS